VKLSSIWFIKQWVTPKLSNELLLEIFSTCLTLLDGNKECPNFQCVYCWGEWSSKLRLFDHRAKGCSNAPKDLRTNNPISIPVLPNLVNAQLSKELKWHIEKNDASSIWLKTRTQANIDAKTALERAPINVEHVHVQLCRFKSMKGF
jgi:hypothetical protein